MAETISIGNSGEYFVAGELERRGFTAGVPMSNTKDFDILAINRNDPTKQYAIQVKTTHSKKKEWMLSKKNETLIAPNIIYVFVALNETDYPEFHIVDSKTVAKEISLAHQKWLNTPNKSGKKHNDTPVRKFNDEKNRYKDNWKILF